MVTQVIGSDLPAGYLWPVNVDKLIVNPAVQVGEINDQSSGQAALYNFGGIHGNTDAVSFGANQATIYNEATGVIDGGYYDGAVLLDGIGDTINNFGKVSGSTIGVEAGLASASSVMNNYGFIVGEEYGVTANSTHTGISIYNDGTIKGGSGGGGIDVGAAVSTGTLATSIINAANGVITSSPGGLGIEIDGGAEVSLTNHGAVESGIWDYGAGNNVIINDGTIQGGVQFGAGSEFYNGAGGTVDAIYCGSGHNRVILGEGDTFVGLGRGHDVVTAGSGHDTFTFRFDHHVDRINDFKTNLDHIELGKGVFAGIAAAPGTGHLLAADFHIGAAATTSSQHIIYNASNGFLSYDPDGSGSGPAVHFATLDPHLHLTASDFLVAA